MWVWPSAIHRATIHHDLRLRTTRMAGHHSHASKHWREMCTNTRHVGGVSVKSCLDLLLAGFVVQRRVWKKLMKKSALFVAGSRYRLNVARLCDEFLWALPKIAHLWWWWWQLSVIVHDSCAAAAADDDDDDDDDGQGNVGQEVSWNDPCFSLFSPYLGSILMLTWEQAVDVEFCLLKCIGWILRFEFSRTLFHFPNPYNLLEWKLVAFLSDLFHIRPFKKGATKNNGPFEIVKNDGQSLAAFIGWCQVTVEKWHPIWPVLLKVRSAGNHSDFILFNDIELPESFLWGGGKIWQIFGIVTPLLSLLHFKSTSVFECLWEVFVDLWSVDCGIECGVPSCSFHWAGCQDDAVDVYGLNVYSWCDEAGVGPSAPSQRQAMNHVYNIYM